MVNLDEVAPELAVPLREVEAARLASVPVHVFRDRTAARLRSVRRCNRYSEFSTTSAGNHASSTVGTSIGRPASRQSKLRAIADAIGLPLGRIPFSSPGSTEAIASRLMSPPAFG